MAPALPEYLWLVIVGGFAAFGFGWGTGAIQYIEMRIQDLPRH